MSNKYTINVCNNPCNGCPLNLKRIDAIRHLASGLSGKLGGVGVKAVGCLQRCDMGNSVDIELPGQEFMEFNSAPGDMAPNAIVYSSDPIETIRNAFERFL